MNKRLLQNAPRIPQDPLYLLLREGNILEFNRRKALGETCDMTHCDFRSLDLVGIDAHGLDWSNSYFKQTDLRGVDLRTTRLEGASFNKALIAGTFFPTEIAPEEIYLSVSLGTRLRYLILNK
jgi:uncharacterized protein YjbI with pentapeptide repeats